MFSAGIIEAKEDGFIGFRKLYTVKYMQNVLKEAGLNEQEIKMITPIIQQARQAHLETKISIRADKKGLNEELIQKMQDSGILYKPQKQTEYIYWKTLYANEEELRKVLVQNGFNDSEQAEIVEHWKKTNITGYDISGLKFINENAAVYNLNNKLNNWTQEKTAWVTNSTEMSGLGENTPSVGISMVQYDKESPVSMPQLRREEKLHTHPNEEKKSQREIYLITSGEAALNVVKNGRTHVEILREGDLAVVGEGVSHCVNSLHGEYEQIVAQVPSAFQYGFEFKTPVEPPKDYDETELQQRAFSELRKEHTKRVC